MSLVSDCVALSAAFPTLSIPTTSCCSYPGITCDTDDRITRLHLFGQNIGAAIGDDIRRLTSLTYVDISYCNVMGGLDAFRGMTWLSVLSLHDNQLTGPLPSWLGSITGMVTFDVEGNQLSGELPPSLAKWKDLRHLGLAANNFEGFIPSAYNKDNWPLLELWTLRNMPLKGTIDARFNTTGLELIRTCITSAPHDALTNNIRHPDCQPSNLRDCSAVADAFPGLSISRTDCCITDSSIICTPEGRVSELRFSGKPVNGNVGWSALQPLSELTVLELAGAGLGGLLNLNPLREATGLKRVSLVGNNLTGSLLNIYGMYFPNMEHFDVSHNALGGSLPDALSQWSKLQVLSLGSNNFEGNLPSAFTRQNWPALKKLSITNMPVKGSLDPGFQDVQIDLQDTCVDVPSTLTQVLHSRHPTCPYTPPTPLPDCIALADAFPTLQISHVACCSIPGILCNDDKRVYGIQLIGEPINAPVGLAIERFPELIGIILNGCGVVGGIGDSYRSLKKLRYLLSGEIPSWLGEELPELEVINLESNRLTGQLPASLGNLRNLTTLNLAKNDLSGDIPSSFTRENWPALKELLLHEMLLTGTLDRTFFNGKVDITNTCITAPPGIRFIRNPACPPAPPAPPSNDCAALADAFPSLALPATNCCGNGEIECDSAGRIVRLTFRLKSINGPAGPSLASLTELSEVIITFSNLSGGFEPFRNLSKLKMLVLFGNGLGVELPDWLGDAFPEMEEFVVSYTEMFGPLPPSLGSWRNLRKLKTQINFSRRKNCPGQPPSASTDSSDCEPLSNAFPTLGISTKNCCEFDGVECEGGRIIRIKFSTKRIDGSVGVSLGQLTELEYFDAHSCNIAGGFDSFRPLRKLKVLSVWANSMFGQLPDWLGDAFPDIEIFHIQWNKFTGSLPASLSKWKKLRGLYLGTSQFTGAVPTSYNGNNWPAIEFIGLSDNLLTGTLDPGLNMRQLEIDASSTCIEAPSNCRDPNCSRSPVLTPPTPSAPSPGTPISPSPDTTPMPSPIAADCAALSAAFPTQNFSATPNCCAISGIRCNAAGRITTIIFNKENINTAVGNIGESFRDLTELSYVDINNCRMTGGLDAFRGLKNLTTLQYLHYRTREPLRNDIAPSGMRLCVQAGNNYPIHKYNHLVRRNLHKILRNCYQSNFDASAYPRRELNDVEDIDIPELPATGALRFSGTQTPTRSLRSTASARPTAALPTGSTVTVEIAGAPMPSPAAGGNDSTFVLAVGLAIGAGVLTIAAVVLAAILAWRMRPETSGTRKPEAEKDSERAEPAGGKLAEVPAVVLPVSRRSEDFWDAEEESAGGFEDHFQPVNSFEEPQESSTGAATASITDKPMLTGDPGVLQVSLGGLGGAVGSTVAEGGSASATSSLDREPNSASGIASTALLSSASPPAQSRHSEVDDPSSAARWTPSQVRDKLVSMGIGAMLAALLEGNGVTGYQLLSMTDDGLGALGVSDKNARALLMFAVRIIKEMHQSGGGDESRPLLS
ncbi:hypothetical protein HDU96_001360 [Phlyctochytrium bullatum]|nr:hypothetical protein HDU96_001360 [Phlyctochytrium bullatum]